MTVAAGLMLLPGYGVNGLAFARALSVLSAPLYVIGVERRALGQVRSRLWLHFLPRAALAAVVAYVSEQLVVSGAPPSWLRLLAALSFVVITYLAVLVATRGLDMSSAAVRILAWRWRRW